MLIPLDREMKIMLTIEYTMNGIKSTFDLNITKSLKPTLFQDVNRAEIMKKNGI